MSENCYNYIYLTMQIHNNIIEFNLLLVLTLEVDKVVISYLAKLGIFHIYAFPKCLKNKYLSVKREILNF